VPHHVLPESGWVSFYVGKREEIEEAIALLRRSYDLALKQQAEAKARAAR
jgi:predicted DNA-binding protein (MmcQ/YjbR family)